MISSRASSRSFAGLLAKGDRIAQRISSVVGRGISRLASTGTLVGTTLQSQQIEDAFEREIDLAANTDVPVLITAHTLAAARRIASLIDERRPDPHPRSLTVVRSSVTVKRLVRLLQDGSDALVFEDVGAFGDDIQNVVLNFLEDRVRRRSSESQYGRIFSTSRPDLYSRVQAGTFREGLYYRLNTVHINVCLPVTVAGTAPERELSAVR